VSGSEKKGLGSPLWVKGVSGNPNGRSIVAERFRQLCRDHAPGIVKRWLREVDESGPDWVKCSELLAAYGFGKPSQQTDINITATSKTTVEERLEQLQSEEIARLASGENE